MAIITCPQCGTKNRVDERAGKLQPVCGKCGAKLNVSVGPVVVTDASFNDALQRAGAMPLLIDCWAPWCGPCRMVGPIIDQLAAEASGRYVIGKLNTDENPRTASQYHIDSIPTMLIFRSGKLVDRVVGLQPKQALLQKLMTHAA